MTRGCISAIITCRDLGRTLVEALRSLERQTRPAADIVIVDDASTDVYTRQVVARLERDGTFVAHGPGRGASAARNLGARLTSGAYLVWLDADDTFEPGYFEAAAARLDADADLDFVSCAMRAFGDVQYVWTPSPPTWVEAVSTGGVPHASTLVRRRVWETVGGFDEDLPTFELPDFWASVLEQGFRGIILDESLLNYRVRTGSGYRQSIRQQTYLARLGHFYEKHRDAVERHGLALLEAKEAFLVSQRNYLKSLESRAAALEAEQAQLRQEIADMARVLHARDLPPVDWGDLRRVRPLSQHWGRDRGTPIDRYYIERFLERHRTDIRGRVLEVHDSVYTQRFGGNAVAARDIVDIDPANTAATITADLRRADAIPAGTYDCIILTQTLQLIDDIGAAVAECARILRPGGVLLATVPGIIRVDDEGGPDGDFWRLTEASARKLFAGSFPIEGFDVTAYGNVMACAAFLYGMSVEELTPAELDHVDSNFPLVIAIRAVKPVAAEQAGLKACTTTDASATTHACTTTDVGTSTGVADTPTVVAQTFRSADSPTAGAQTFRSACASPRAAILAYHRVADFTPDSHALCTPPEVFRAHMAFLRDNFSPIGLEDLVRAAASGRIPERAVAVTLDDGYLDALSVASPILAELGVPATFFVNTDRLDEEHERWWDILERVFLSESTLPAVLALTVAGQDLRMPTTTAGQRADALESLNRLAWPLDAHARAGLARDVLAWSGTDRAPRDTHRVMTGDELRELASRPGHAIGAHTTHHLALTTQPPETQRMEVVDHRVELERLLQRPVHLFSYPYGDFDAGTLTIVSEAGFRAAVTVEAGLVRAGANRLLLPRCEIGVRQRADFPSCLREIFDACLLSR